MAYKAVILSEAEGSPAQWHPSLNEAEGYYANWMRSLHYGRNDRAGAAEGLPAD